MTFYVKFKYYPFLHFITTQGLKRKPIFFLSASQYEVKQSGKSYNLTLCTLRVLKRS